MTNAPSKRVLVLDDERVIVDTLCIILGRHGFVSRGAYTHAGAIEVAREFQPEVFITGMVNACDQNGCETAAEVVELVGKCRVLVMSGSGYEWAVQLSQEYGMRGYHFEVWQKPIHPQKLLTWLESL